MPMCAVSVRNKTEHSILCYIRKLAKGTGIWNRNREGSLYMQPNFALQNV